MRLRRLAYRCQGNYAVAVKETLPTSSTTLAATTTRSATVYPVPDSCLRHFHRDRHASCGIITLTSFAVLHGGPHEHTQGCQESRLALHQQWTLYLHPEAVSDLLFRTHEFFDARDLVQVKYEMLRRVRVEGVAITVAAAAFGFSRPAFYQAQVAYQRHGLPGLIPQRPGPRHAHKLSGDVLDFVLQHLAQNPALRAAALATLIEEAFGLTVHPRSLERALARRRKKSR